MPLSFDDALTYTDPNAQESEREASARALQAGVAASEIYWNHTDPLTALKALHEGHTQPGQIEAQQPTADAVGTAVEEPAIGPDGTPVAPQVPASTGTDIPAGTTADPNVSVSGVHPDPSPQNPNEAIARLRQQLTDAGLNPEA